LRVVVTVAPGAVWSQISLIALAHTFVILVGAQGTGGHLRNIAGAAALRNGTNGR